MAFNGENASEFQPKELMIFDRPPLQTAVENVFYDKIQPISQITGSSPIEFVLAPQNSLHYIDLKNSFMSVKTRIRHRDGRTLTANEYCGPVNLLIHSLFEQVDVTLQGRHIIPPSTHYPFKSMFEVMTKYGGDSKSSQLSSQGWVRDTAFHVDDDDIKTGKNDGLKERSKPYAESKLVHLISDIHHDLFKLDKFLLNQIAIAMKFYRSKPEFYLVSDGLQPDFVADIEEMTIYLRKIQVNPAIVYAHSMALQKSSAKYLFNRSEVRMTAISQGHVSFSYDNICVDRLANKVVIGFVSSSSVVGSYNSSPFNFQGFDLRQITLSVDGIPVNNNTLSVSYDSSTGYDTVEAYVSLLQSSGKWLNDAGNQLTTSDLAGGFALYSFNIAPIFEGETYTNLIRKGNVRIDARFGTPLPHPVTCIIFTQTSSMFEVTLAREVIVY